MTLPSHPLYCPVCKLPVKLAHADTNLLVHDCGTVLNRLEGDVLRVKECAVITDPTEALKPGTTGVDKGTGFTILGRSRLWFTSSVFNYWTLLLDDGSLAYLGEGYGLYSVLRPVTTLALSADALEQLKTGGSTDALSPTPACLENKGNCVYWEIEGEVYLPGASPAIMVAEFALQGGQHITVFKFFRDYLRGFQGRYAEFGQFRFSGLRDVPEPGKDFVCEACQHSFRILGYPFTTTCTCPHCRCTYSMGNGRLQKISLEPTGKVQPDLLLGSTGTIDDIVYTVTGFVQKRENGPDGESWREYTLYHPHQGTAFLSEFTGNWIFARQRKEAPLLFGAVPARIQFKQEPFELFNSYTCQVEYYSGEFPYNLATAHQVQCDEFISPPETWIREKSDADGIEWYFGKKIPLKHMRSHFAFRNEVPEKKGLGMLDPAGFISLNILIVSTVVGALGILLCTLVSGLFHSPRQIYKDALFFSSDSVNIVSVVTPSFNLSRASGAMEFRINAAVDNSWVEVSATLVNLKTGSEYSLEQGVEYYWGYSGGESWSEGGTSESAFLSGIPEGEYSLQLQGTRESYGVRPGSIDVQVIYDVPLYRNILFGLLFMLVWPVIRFIRIRYNETERWSSSPYSKRYED